MNICIHLELLDHEMFMFSFGRYGQFAPPPPSHMVRALETGSSVPLPGPITEEVSLLSGLRITGVLPVLFAPDVDSAIFQGALVPFLVKLVEEIRIWALAGFCSYSDTAREDKSFKIMSYPIDDFTIKHSSTS